MILLLLLLQFSLLVDLVSGADVRVNVGSSPGSSSLVTLEDFVEPAAAANLPPPPVVIDDLLMADATSPNNNNIAAGLMMTSCQDTPRQLRMLAIAQRSIILYCDVSPAVAAHDHLIQWKREPDLAPIFARQGTFLPYIHPSYEGRLSIVDDALLKIDPVQESDEGWYRCEIHFTRPEMCPRTPNRVHLSVQSHPQLITNESSPDQVNRPIGASEVTLRCTFNGTPQPEVTWTKYSWHRGYEVLRPSPRIKITASSLTIKSFSKLDSGRYQCRAANLVGEATHQISLVADGTVVLIVPPSNVTVDEGDEAVFHCKVDGYPSAIKYRWFHDGVEIVFPPPLASISSSEDGAVINSGSEPLRSRIERFTAIHSGQSSVLVINPTNRKDSGRYSCEGSNIEAIVRTPDAQLSVKFKPNFVNMKSFMFLPLGLSVNLTCSAEANPPVTKYSWAKGNNFDITGSRFRFSEDGRILNVQNVTRDDAGTYICFVTNDFATDKFEIDVQVTDPPVFSAVPRPLTQVIKGSGVTIACRALATIVPTVSWMKDGQPLETTERVQVSDGNLIIHDVNMDDQGEYLCLASNVAATVVQRTRIVVEDEARPHAPRNLSVDTGTYSATLTWLPAYNRGLQSYIVQYRAIATPDLKLSSNRPVSPPPWQQMRVFPEGALTFTIYNLLPNSTYEFRVMARSIEPGDGLYSLPVVEKTKAVKPNRKLSSSYADDGFIEDGFANAPLQQPEMLTIRTSKQQQQVLKQQQHSTKSTLQPQITPAIPITKAAVSDRSVDLVSHPESLMYAGPKPPAPRNVTGTALPRSITLRWAPPDNSTLITAVAASTGSKLTPSYTCYTIEYMAGQDSEWRQLANVTAATDSFVLSNPTPKVVYRFRIAACNAKTIGYYSDTIVLTSEEAGNLMQVTTETALLGIAGCAVVLIIIISVVVICVRYNRSPSPYDRHRQRQCKFVNLDGSGGGSPLTASTPPNKMPLQQQLLLNGNGNGSAANYHLHNGLLTTANNNNNGNMMMPNGKSYIGISGMMNNGTCPNSNSMGSCNGGLLLGSSSSSNSGGTATLPKDGNGEWQLPSPGLLPIQQRSSTSSAPAPISRQQQSFGFVAECRRHNNSNSIETGNETGPHCRYCRGSSLIRRQHDGGLVFPNNNKPISSSSGEELNDEESETTDEMTHCLSSTSKNTYYNHIKSSNSNNNNNNNRLRPLGRLETLLLMDEGDNNCQQQQQILLRSNASRNSRHQVTIVDGDYDNISQICDSCGVAAVDGLYVRSRSPLGRYLDGNMRILPTQNNNSTTTDVTSRSSSIESSDGVINGYSNLPSHENATDLSNILYSNLVSDVSPPSPHLCEMPHVNGASLLVNIITPPSSQHLSPRSNNKAVTFVQQQDPNNTYYQNSTISETRI